MGNQKSREENNFKLQIRIRHPLPPELLYEISKWIPIKIERRQEKQQNQSKILDHRPRVVNKKRFAFWQQNKKRTRWSMMRRHSEFRKLTITYIGPENENILVANRILTAFLRQKCSERRKMLTKLATDYFYEPYPLEGETWHYLAIRKKVNSDPAAENNNFNNSPKLTMSEMMRHFCFGRSFMLNEYNSSFVVPLETMPDDFNPDHFIRLFVEYTTNTANIEMIAEFKIKLTEQQYQCVLKALDDDRNCIWASVHKPQYYFTFNYYKDYYYKGQFSLGIDFTPYYSCRF